MSAEKTSDVMTSMKRLYSRGLVLTSAVVFGGIAIAQAQKDTTNSPSSQTELSLLEVSDVAPLGVVPLAKLDGNTERHSSNGDARIALANVELPEPAETPAAFADDNDAWAESPPSDYLPTEEADLDAEVLYEIDDVADDDYSEAAPELPDPVAFPAEVESAPLAQRGNPYRDPTAPPASIYSDDSLEREYDLEDSANADEIALPDIDNAALPDGRNGGAFPVSSQTAVAAELPEPLSTPQPQADEPDVAGQFSQPSAYSNPIDELTPDDELSPVESDQDPLAGGASRYGAIQPLHSSSQPPLNDDNDRLDDNGHLEAGGKPGPQSMEGPQSPSLTVQKRAPEEIQVGRPAKFDILVRNTGRVTAENVVIRDEIPAGTNFVDATPKASRAQGGAVYWEAGSLAPGQEFTVSMELLPTTEGQIGSVATVSFQASASAKSRATKPQLVLEHSGPLKVLVGDAVQFSIKISNPGTGAATQVVLEEDVPQGLAHSSGARLEYEVGSVEPGQTRHLELSLKADKAGHVINTLIARADGGLVAEDVVELDVVAPDLQVAIEGPNRRYLERQATFTIAVANPGSAPARNVELVAQLPTGLKFVSTNNSGFYDQSRHAVIWSLEQLPAGEMGKAQFTAMPVEMGSFQIHAQGQAEMGLQASQDHDLSVEGIAALFFGVADKVDPIEVGGQTTYEIKVVNQGSKSATNVQFAALVPDGLQTVGAQGPTQEALEGQRVMFAPIPSLAPQEEAIFRITVSGHEAGDHRFRVQMTSDETTTPVIKEESTRVYSD